MTVYAEIVVAAWIVFGVVWLSSAVTSKRNLGYSAWLWGTALRLVVFIVVVLVFHFTGWLGSPGSYAEVTNNPTLGAFGSFFAVAGIAFAVWARFHLGKNWGMPMSVKESPELVTTGPYAYVRHPIYTGVMLAIFGSVLVVGVWWLTLFVLMSAYFVYSATREEKLMLKEFPDTYPAYKKRTKMLIPFVL